MRRIMELLDNPVAWEITVKTSGMIEVRFTVGSIGYTVDIEMMGIRDNHWNIEFGIDDNTPSNSKYGITDTGNASIVFSTVVDILKTLLRDEAPDEFSFTAGESSRVSLYQTMSKIIVRQIPEYELTSSKEDLQMGYFYFAKVR